LKREIAVRFFLEVRSTVNKEQEEKGEEKNVLKIESVVRFFPGSSLNS
jgi:hypothetical protein